ncbi:hypothetical protein AVEN_168032-1 [Araneus ventricosus]|uniref:Uncharacterized protein n=1 Tax=Araneus ventricosus TaxID=182803 RepID=A0A4Y2JV66_ARAVE|nr:hypothetical protein AVEN_168032-1 [Araneus ventricosus]
MSDVRYSGSYASCLLMTLLFATFSNILAVKLQGKSFSGPIQQQPTSYEKQPVVDYKPIDCSIPNINRKLVIKDQQYLLGISNAISLVHCPEDLANRDWSFVPFQMANCGQPSP